MLDLVSPETGNKIISDGEAINIVNALGQVILTYHPTYGECIFGVNKPETILNARGDLSYATRLLGWSEASAQ